MRCPKQNGRCKSNRTFLCFANCPSLLHASRQATSQVDIKLSVKPHQSTRPSGIVISRDARRSQPATSTVNTTTRFNLSVDVGQSSASVNNRLHTHMQQRRQSIAPEFQGNLCAALLCPSQQTAAKRSRCPSFCLSCPLARPSLFQKRKCGKSNPLPYPEGVGVGPSSLPVCIPIYNTRAQ